MRRGAQEEGGDLPQLDLHAHGITRINAYAGIATAYLVLDAINAAYTSAGKIPGIPSTIPLVFQDEKFVSATTPITDPTWATVARPDVQSIGSLWYEHIYDPKEFRLLKSQQNLTPPNPSAIPELFGDTMLANGTVYPQITVQARRYRIQFLNACSSRFLNLQLFEADATADGITLNAAFNPTNLPYNPPASTGLAAFSGILIGYRGRAASQPRECPPQSAVQPVDPAGLPHPGAGGAGRLHRGLHRICGQEPYSVQRRAGAVPRGRAPLRLPAQPHGGRAQYPGDHALQCGSRWWPTTIA